MTRVIRSRAVGAFLAGALSVGGAFALTGVAGATPPGGPAAPTAAAVTPGNHSLTVSWTAPSDTSNVDYYVASTANSAAAGGVTTCIADVGQANQCTLRGLTNGDTYTVNVQSVQDTGSGTLYSSTVTGSGTPQGTLSGPPLNVQLSPGSTTMDVTWNAPTLSGFSGSQPYSITGYNVTLSPGGATCTAAAGETTCKVTGLTPHTAYSAVVQSFNNSGAGGTPAAGGTSQPSPYVSTISTAPSMGSIDGVVDGNGTVTVSFTDGAANGSPITSNVVRAIAPDLSVAATCGPSSLVTSPCTLSGLTNGTTYTIQLIDTNAIGSSPAAATATATPYTVPGQLQVSPTATASTVAGTPSITLTWPVWGTAGAPSTGGSPVSSYKVLVWGVPYTVSAATACDASTCSFTTSTGISYGGWYHPVVLATGAGNDGGPAVDGLYSYQSNQVFPGFAPVAPASVTATPKSTTTAAVSWPFATASAGNGGWQVTDYVLQVKSGGTVVQTLHTNSGHVRNITVTGLTVGTTYTYSVYAKTGNGTNSDTTTSSPVLQAVAPGPITGLAATPGVGSINLTWNALADSGAPVTYTIIEHTGVSAPVTLTTTATGTSYLVTGLTSGHSYWFSVQAKNSAGSSLQYIVGSSSL